MTSLLEFFLTEAHHVFVHSWRLTKEASKKVRSRIMFRVPLLSGRPRLPKKRQTGGLIHDSVFTTVLRQIQPIYKATLVSDFGLHSLALP